MGCRCVIGNFGFVDDYGVDDVVSALYRRQRVEVGGLAVHALEVGTVLLLHLDVVNPLILSRVDAGVADDDGEVVLALRVTQRNAELRGFRAAQTVDEQRVSAIATLSVDPHGVNAQRVGRAVRILQAIDGLHHVVDGTVKTGTGRQQDGNECCYVIDAFHSFTLIVSSIW